MATEISKVDSGLDPLPYHGAAALTALIAAEKALVEAQIRRDEAAEWHRHITGMMLAKAPTEAPPKAPAIPERPETAPEPPPAPPDPEPAPTPPRAARRRWWTRRTR